MELIALGTSGGWPAPRRAASGYLLRHDGYTIAMDLGTGTLARLLEMIGLEDLDAVVISHAHYDHFLDLYPLFVARSFHRGEPLKNLPIVAPTGFMDYLLRLTKEENDDMRRMYVAQEVEPGETTELGPLRIETRPMSHLIPTIGVRVSAGGLTVAYTGDTGTTEEVETIGRDADALLSEAAWPEMDEPPWFHLTAAQAAGHANRAGAKRLILSHFLPTTDRDASREQAAAVYDGELEIFDERSRLEITP